SSHPSFGLTGKLAKLSGFVLLDRVTCGPCLACNGFHYGMQMRSKRLPTAGLVTMCRVFNDTNQPTGLAERAARAGQACL
ncbi:MAG: hypothetical protein AAGK01_08610, partial [Pseudomonadota bacterium]